MNQSSKADQQPTHFNFFSDLVEPLAASHGDKCALIAFDREGSEKRLTFGEIADLALKYGNALAAAGVGPGDTVMTVVGSTVEWVATLIGSWRIGAVALPCSEMLRSKDLKWRIDSAAPKVVVSTKANQAELEAAVAVSSHSPVILECDGNGLAKMTQVTAETVKSAIDDEALIVFTSGTTGQPKPVLHLQRYLWAQKLQAKYWMDINEDDTVWCTASTGWSKSSRNVFVTPWQFAATAVLHNGRFDPAVRQELIERAGVNVLCQSPTEYRIEAKESTLDKRKLKSLRHLVSAGEPLNPKVISLFKQQIGLEIYDSYGQTETGALTAMPLGKEVRSGSMGKPLPGFELKVEEGELIVKTDTVPTLFNSYLGEPAVGGQWYRTGDRVRQDSDGYLWFEGRNDDIILSSGYRIGPFEVESALLEHPRVAEAAAVAAADEERGAVVKAFVVLNGGQPSQAMAEELQEHVKSVTAPYKYPRQVEFVDQLPKTRSGKIQRSKLR